MQVYSQANAVCTTETSSSCPNKVIMLLCSNVYHEAVGHNVMVMLASSSDPS